MTAAIFQQNEITYGSYVVGGSQDARIHGPVQIDWGFGGEVLSFRVLVSAATDSAFVTACQALEDAYRARRVNMTWKHGPTGSQVTARTWSHSGNTGFNTTAECRKSGTKGADSNRSRLYDVTLRCEFPADDASGRRDSSMSVDFLPSRQRVVRFAGVWTCLTSGSARSTYNANAPGFFSSALTGLDSGASFEKTAELVQEDDQNKVITFTCEFTEILEQQSSGTLDNANIVRSTVAYTRTTSRPGDSLAETARLEGFVVTFDCWVNKENTTDLATVYESTAKPHLLARLRAQFPIGTLAIIDEQRALLKAENRISATLQIMAHVGGSQLVESTETSGYDEAGGTVFTNAWANGIYKKWRDLGHGTRLRVVERLLVKIGEHDVQPRINGAEWEGPWALMRWTPRRTIVRMGQSDSQIVVTRIQTMEAWEYSEEPSTGGGDTVTGRPSDGGATPPPGSTTPTETGVSPIQEPNPTMTPGGWRTSPLLPGGTLKPGTFPLPLGGGETPPHLTGGGFNLPGGAVDPGIRLPGSDS